MTNTTLNNGINHITTCMTNTNKTNQEIDEAQARELYLFAINDGKLYIETLIPAIINLKRYIKRGVFDEESAIKYFSGTFAIIAKRAYEKEIDTIGRMNQATKNVFGKNMYESLKEQIFEKEGAN